MMLKGAERFIMFDEYFDKLAFILFTEKKENILPYLKMMVQEQKNKRKFCANILHTISSQKFQQYRIDYPEQWHIINEYCTEGKKLNNWFVRDAGKNTIWLIGIIITIVGWIQKFSSSDSNPSTSNSILIVGFLLLAVSPKISDFFTN